MADAPRHIEPSPDKCPHCGSRRLGPTRPGDMEVAPLDPDEVPDAHPGMMECKDCGAIVQWEP